MTIAPLLRSVGLAALALAFLMPGHYLPWASFQGQWVAALGVALVVLGAAARGGRTVAVPALALLAFASALIPPLQWLTGQIGFVSDALLPAAYFVAFGLALIGSSVWTQFDRVAWLDQLFLALAGAAMLSVALAAMQWLSLGGGLFIAATPPGARPFANLGQPNHLALLIALGVVGIARAYARGQLGGVPASFAIGWLLFGLVMTQSRTGWLIAGLLMLWWAILRRRVPLPALTRTRVLAAGTLFVVAVLGWDRLNEALMLTQVSNLEERLQAGPRHLIWQAMLEAVRQAPWAGYGFNQVVLAHQAVAADGIPVQRMLESAHNVVLDAALWAGLPFALLWVGAIAVWLLHRWRVCADVDDGSVLAAVGAIFVHAMLEFPLDHLYFLLPLALLMGSFASTLRRPTSRAVAWALALPALAMTTLLFAVGAEYLQVEQASHRVRLALFGVGDPNSPDAAPPEVHLLDAPREYHRLMLTPAREGMSTDELDWMRRVTMRHAFPPAMLRYALAAGLNGRADEAALTLRRLCSMHPPQRCNEARASWRGAQSRWPALAAVPLP